MTIKYFRTTIYLVCIVFLAAGCLPRSTESNSLQIAEPVPTLHLIFMEDQSQEEISVISRVEPATFTREPQERQATATEEITPTISPTVLPTATPTFAPTSTPTLENLPTVVVYDETLNENWSLVASSGIEFVLQKRGISQSGTYSMAITPLQDYGTLAFTVRFASKEVYLREQTLGVRFWLYTGEAVVETDDLSVSVVGSNEVPYWKWNDQSVTNIYEPLFSETRLYDLDFNQAIPPDTWVQVEVWLDELEFDPVYQYVTGIFIKTGEDFRNTIYIDQVELVQTPGSP